MAKRRILLVDDEVTVLLTMKAILEISGYDVDTAASAREGKSKIKLREYQMVITDMRMESDAAGRDVIQAARTAAYHPAVALLTAFPLSDEDWQDMGADKMLVKPMHTRLLIQQIEKLMEKHAAKLARLAGAAAASPLATPPAAPPAVAKAAAKKAKPAAKKAAKKSSAKPAKNAAFNPTAKKPAAKKSSAQKSPTHKSTAKKPFVKKSSAKKSSAKKSTKR